MVLQIVTLRFKVIFTSITSFRLVVADIVTYNHGKKFPFFMWECAVDRYDCDCSLMKLMYEGEDN